MRTSIVEAQNAFVDAAKEFREPYAWAVAQVGIGTTSLLLATRGDAQNLQSAVDAFDRALSVQTRTCTPLEWASTQGLLGMALGLQGQTESNVRTLQKAEAAFRAELEVHTNQSFPSEWAAAQVSLSSVLAIRGYLEHDPWPICQAFHRAMRCEEVDDKYCAQSGASVTFVASTALLRFDKKSQDQCQHMGGESWHTNLLGDEPIAKAIDRLIEGGVPIEDSIWTLIGIIPSRQQHLPPDCAYYWRRAFQRYGHQIKSKSIVVPPRCRPRPTN
jgi:hypothetical protein